MPRSSRIDPPPNTAAAAIPALLRPLESSQPFACFVIPTYNEVGTIGRLIERLLSLHRDDVHLLIVDDRSPDGTARVVKDAMARSSRVHLVEGERAGLGVAYVRGFEAALAQFDPQVVVQMDADLSHDPEASIELLDVVRDRADVAIGSRYVAGGRLDAGWSQWRRLLSRFGNLGARYIAGLYAVRDCTSGFKAIRAGHLRDVGLATIGVQGYAFQVALLHRLVALGARVEEVPIYFSERAAGETKLGLADVVEFFWNVWWLRVQSARRFLRFVAVGASGVVVNLGSFWVLLTLGVHRFVASPIAIEVSIVWNFLWNNYWTFADRELVGRNRVRGLRFNLVSLGTLALSFGTFLGLQWLDPDGLTLLHQAAGIVPGVLVNYFLNAYWTFRDRSRPSRR